MASRILLAILLSTFAIQGKQVRLQRNRMKSIKLKKARDLDGLSDTRHNLSTYEDAGWTIFNRSDSPRLNTYSEFLLPIPRYGTAHVRSDLLLLNGIVHAWRALHGSGQPFTPLYPLAHVTLTGSYMLTEAEFNSGRGILARFLNSYQGFPACGIQVSSTVKTEPKQEGKVNVVNFMYFFGQGSYAELETMTANIVKEYSLPVKLQTLRDGSEGWRFGGTKVSLFSILLPKDVPAATLAANGTDILNGISAASLLAMMTPVIMQKVDGKWLIRAVFQPGWKQDQWDLFEQKCDPFKPHIRVGGVPHPYFAAPVAAAKL